MQSMPIALPTPFLFPIVKRAQRGVARMMARMDDPVRRGSPVLTVVASSLSSFPLPFSPLNRPLLAECLYGQCGRPHGHCGRTQQRDAIVVTPTRRPPRRPFAFAASPTSTRWKVGRNGRMEVGATNDTIRSGAKPTDCARRRAK
jgi:hypothetical protein